MKRGLLVLWMLGTLTAPGVALGQGEDAAAAEVLFRDGQRLRKRGQYDQACPKLAESYRLDPATGSLLALALCLEGRGRLASAWSAYVHAASRARRDGESDREQAARDRAQHLDGRLSKLTVEVSPTVSRLAGLEVLRDRGVIARAAWSVDVPVDGGEHVIEARAPGHVPWKSSVLVAREGDAKTVRIAHLAPQPPARGGTGSKTSASRPGGPRTARSASEPADHGLRPHQALALGLAAGGVVGLGIGSYFGLEALGKKRDAQAAGCDDHGVCPNDSKGAELINQGRSAGNISTVAFVAGGALLAGAAAVYLLGGRDGSRDRAQGPIVLLEPGLGNVLVHGSF